MMIAFGGFELLVLLAFLASPLIGVWNFLDATAREIDVPVLTYRYRGLALHQQGELDLAIETFNQAIKVMPEAPGTISVVGWHTRIKANLTWPSRTLTRRFNAARIIPVPTGTAG